MCCAVRVHRAYLTLQIIFTSLHLPTSIHLPMLFLANINHFHNHYSNSNCNNDHCLSILLDDVRSTVTLSELKWRKGESLARLTARTTLNSTGMIFCSSDITFRSLSIPLSVVHSLTSYLPFPLFLCVFLSFSLYQAMSLLQLDRVLKERTEVNGSS